MTSAADQCRRRRRYESEDSAWRAARSLGKRLVGRYRAWSCSDHWHVGHARRSIEAVFAYLEREREARG